MSEMQSNPAYDELPEEDGLFGVAVDATGGNDVDVSWLRGFDLDLMDAFYRYVGWQAAKGAFDDGLICEQRDARSYAHSVGRTVSSLLNACKSSTAEPLVILLILASCSGYEAGVRDAFEGRITARCCEAMALAKDAEDDRYFKMRAFHRELKSL